MSGRAIRTTSRIAFFLCGLVSLFTGVPFLMLRGIELPFQSEWVLFVAALSVVGFFSTVLAVLPRSWIAKACKKGREDEQLFLALLKWVGGFAAISYLVGRTEFQTRMIQKRAQGGNAQTDYESEMALFYECMQQCAQNVLDTGRHC